MAVYTTVTQADLETLLEDYDLGTLRAFEGIRQGVENTNYHIFTDRGRYILTLFERRVDPADLPYFFAFTDHLAARGVACPLALPDRHGLVIRYVCDRPAAIISFLPGETMQDIVLTPAICRNLGAEVAGLHRAAEGFRLERENSMGLKAWRGLADKMVSDAPKDYAELIRDELAWLEGGWPEAGDHVLPRRSVHADIFPDNVFHQDGRISGFIDFYFACTDFLIYDLALVINAWCFTDGVLDNARLDALLAGYCELRPMTEGERALLVFMCRAAALRIMLTRLYDWINCPPDALVTPKDPAEYKAILECHRRRDAVNV